MTPYMVGKLAPNSTHENAVGQRVAAQRNLMVVQVCHGGRWRPECIFGVVVHRLIRRSLLTADIASLCYNLVATQICGWWPCFDRALCVRARTLLARAALTHNSGETPMNLSLPATKRPCRLLLPNIPKRQ